MPGLETSRRRAHAISQPATQRGVYKCTRDKHTPEDECTGQPDSGFPVVWVSVMFVDTWCEALLMQYGAGF